MFCVRGTKWVTWNYPKIAKRLIRNEMLLFPFDLDDYEFLNKYLERGDSLACYWLDPDYRDVDNLFGFVFGSNYKWLPFGPKSELKQPVPVCPNTTRGSETINNSMYHLAYIYDGGPIYLTKGEITRLRLGL